MRKSMLLRSALLLALLPFASGAQTLYKCVSKGKPTSFQSEPCSASQREAGAVDYVPDRVGPYRPDVRSRPYASGGHQAQTVTVPMARTPDLCAMARANRDNLLGRNNQNSSYGLRVQLNDAVQRACN